MNKWMKIVGTVAGETLAIRGVERESTFHLTPPEVIMWGNKRMFLNMNDMRPSLARLVPVGFLTPTVKAKHWEPFIRMANAIGALRA